MTKRARTDAEAAWLDALAAMLLEEEAGVAAALEPLVLQTIDDLEAIIEALPPTSPSRDLEWTAAQLKVDRLLSTLNRRLEKELGAALSSLQKPLQRHCLELAQGEARLPQRTAGELLRLVRVNGAPLSDLLRERPAPRGFK